MTKTKRAPQRTCVGCNVSKDKKDLIRIVDTEEGLRLDVTGKMNGRGVYVCPNKECIALAQKKNGIKRSLKKNIDNEEISALFEELTAYEKESV